MHNRSGNSNLRQGEQPIAQEEMNLVLLECKKKAKLMVEMKDPAVLVGERRKEYIKVMKELFDEAAYEHLGFTLQNLRDQAAHLEKSLGNVTGNVSSKVGRRPRNELESSMQRNETCESTQVLKSEIHCNIIVNTHVGQNAIHDEMDLHSRHANQENPVGPDNSSLSEGAVEVIEKSTQLLGLVNEHPGDYTRTKQRPSRNDIDNINRAVSQLMSQNSISPVDNSFG